MCLKRKVILLVYISLMVMGCSEGVIVIQGKSVDKVSEPSDEDGCPKLCKKGQTVCAEDGRIMECGDWDNNGCLRYETFTCDNNKVCENGKCRTKKQDGNDDTEPKDGEVCEDECTDGNKTCVDNNYVMTCADWGDGCLREKQTECGKGSHCLNGLCILDDKEPECSNECEEENKRECVEGVNGYRVCGNFDDDVCFEWSAKQGCSDNQKCEEGYCVNGCTNVCNENGQRECVGNSYHICADYNSDGCLEWDDLKACSGRCEGGECKCENECNEAGKSECVGNGFRTCTMGDEGCLVWTDVTGCPAICKDGKCECDHQCTSGAQECSGNGYHKCKTNDQGCRVWSEVTKCNNGCDKGECKSAVVKAPTRYPGDRVVSPVTAYSVEKMKEIMQKKSENNLRFSKFGDSHMVSGSTFMYCFSKDSNIDYGGGKSFSGVVNAYKSGGFDSFSRDSLCAKIGQTASWANSGNMASEISSAGPRFGFYGYGTNDMGMYGYTRPTGDATKSGYFYTLNWYYNNVLKSVETMISSGVIPLFIGTGLRNDNEDKGGLAPRHFVPVFDAVARGIAESYQVPYINLALAMKNCTNYGVNTTDKIHLNNYSGGACKFTADGLKYGGNVRNRYAIEMLDKAWRAVIQGEAAPDNPVVFEGSGTKAKPYIISSIPYTHSGNTTGGENNFSQYGCNNANEGGPEKYYQMTLTKSQKIRAFALSQKGVDVDIHLKNTVGDNSCLTRGDTFVEGNLSAGTYYFVIDTFGSNANAGGYLFGVVNCDSDDSLCGTSNVGG